MDWISPNATDSEWISEDSKNAENTTSPRISETIEASGSTELQQKDNDDQLKSGPLALNSSEFDIKFAATIDELINTEDESFWATKTIQKCEPCLYDNIIEEAQSFCVVCAEFLCKTCTRDHRKSKTTRGHNVLDGEKFPATADIFKKLKETMACADHPESEVSYKCKQHKKYICADCTAVKHKKCLNVSQVSKTTAVSDEKRKVLFQTLKAIHESTCSIRASKEQNIESLRKNAIDIGIDRQEHINSIQTHLENLIQQSAKDAEIHLMQEIEKLNKEVNKCKDIETKEKEHENLLNVAFNHGSIKEQNVLYEKITEQANILSKDSKKLDVKAKTTLQYLKDTKIQEMSSIGKVFIRKDSKDENVSHHGSLLSSSDALDEKAEKAIIAAKETDTSSSKLKDDQKTGISKQVPLIQGKLVNETAEKAIFAAKEKVTISSKLKDDKRTDICKQAPLIQGNLKKMRTMYDIKTDVYESTCSVTAIVLLANGRFVISDKANKKIKVLDADFSVSISYKLDSEPIDMCEASPDLLAVISNNVKEVKKFTLSDNRVIPNGSFPTKNYPISISQSNSGIIILFSDEPKDNPKKNDKDVIELQMRNVHDGMILFQTSNFKTERTSLKIVLENANRVVTMGSNPELFFIAEEKKVRCFRKDTERITVLPWYKSDDVTRMTEIWFYRSYHDNILEGASDMTIDSERNVYLCSENCRNVYQLSLENYKNNRVLMSVPASPTSLCVDSSRRIIVIGCKNDDFLYVAYFQ